jgi:heptosyltransferase II
MIKANNLLPSKRILVMRYRFIGDTILTVPFLRNLRLAYPDAKIDVLVGPQSGEVLNGCPYVDELIVFDTTRFHKYDRSQQKPRNLLSYALELRKKKYDTTYVLKRSLSAAILGMLIGAKHRIGYDTEGRGIMLTHRVKWDPKIHEVESMLDVLRAVNVPIVYDSLEAWVSEEESKNILVKAPALREAGPKALIHAASAHPDKLYPLEHWATIIRELHREFGITPYFTGAEQDQTVYRELSERSGVPCIDLSGQLTLRESIAVYSKMDLAICTDSGPAHLAAAVQTPTLSLFGPTDPNRWRPWGEKHAAIYDATLTCRPCNYNKTCGNRECLTELDPMIVVARSREILSRLGEPSVR